MTDTRPRDPDCTCGIEFPGARRIWCDHCLTDGPLPGSLADPESDPGPVTVADHTTPKETP